jgi:hypothetical protein
MQSDDQGGQEILLDKKKVKGEAVVIDGMRAGMVHGMVLLWLSPGFNHQGKYMA